MTATPKKRRRGLPVKSEVLGLIEEKMRDKGFEFTTDEEKYYALADKTGLSFDRIRYIFNPQFNKPDPERKTIQVIAKVLDIDPSDIVEGWNPTEFSRRVKSIGSQVYILNRQTFQEMLDKQRELTANPLINANFEASKLYVPLGLVESKKQERRKDVGPEMGSRLYRPEEYEITRQFENDEFLTEVLLQGNSPKSKGKRIAIIGEPGSGKTTRLQQIADRIFNKNDDNLVIWVSLADLQDRTLEDFLLNTWLKIALKQKEASEESQNELIEKFNEGNVWLLLDGLDEMVLDSNLLVWVDSQINKINGWIKSAKIILTCRVNVWESGNNYLSYFDVYRNLDFSEPQRDEFIYKFFTDRNLADQLITELNRDGKERIRDLVKNPLRLTLVCYSWKNHQGSLPETKAGLYQECVEAFYLWKEVQLKKTIAQRKQLNQALGELAKQALEQNSSRFRLTKSFICKVLGESDEGLFKLALDLGWLNRVGVAEENPSEQVYAFFHPSFQEYFAALAIDNWNFFLNHNNDNPNPFNKYNEKDCVYRVFEKEWQEVIRYWYNRKDIDNDQKYELINVLRNFEDNCKSIYKILGILNAVVYVSEFTDICQHEIFQDFIDLLASNFEHESELYFFYCDSIRSRAREVFFKVNINQSLTIISNLLNDSEFRENHIFQFLIDLLGDLTFTNPSYAEKIKYMLKKIEQYTTNEEIKIRLESELEINQFYIKDRNFNWAKECGKYIQKRFQFIELTNSTLNKHRSEINPKSNELSNQIVVFIAQKASPKSPQLFLKRILYNVLKSSSIERKKVLLSIAEDNLEKNIINHKNFLSKESKERCIDLLIEDIQKSFFLYIEHSSLATLALQIILKIIIPTKMPKIIDFFKIHIVEEILEDQQSSNELYELFLNCAEHMTYPEFYKAWHSQPEIIHPEILEISPLGNTAIAQTLNQQILDLPSQLQPTEKTYPLIINAQSLEDETDNSSIAQEICNQIYAIAFPDETNIPEINNFSKLKREIPKIKKQLNTQNLALIFHKGEPNESLNIFCKQLATDTHIHIRWITKQKMEYINGILPQENLVNILQNWINQLD